MADTGNLPAKLIARHYKHLGRHKKRAIEGLIQTGTVVGACQFAGIGRSTWYHWLKTEPDFAEAVEYAREEVADMLEERAIQRAMEMSDTLLIFLLKGLRPEKYGNKGSLEVSGLRGAPIQAEAVQTPKVTKEEWLRLHGLDPNLLEGNA